MSALLFLILASLALAISAFLGFVWAVKSGQFEDTCTPSMRLLMEEESVITKPEFPGGTGVSPARTSLFTTSGETPALPGAETSNL